MWPICRPSRCELPGVKRFKSGGSRLACMGGSQIHHGGGLTLSREQINRFSPHIFEMQTFYSYGVSGSASKGGEEKVRAYPRFSIPDKCLNSCAFKQRSATPETTGGLGVSQREAGNNTTLIEERLRAPSKKRNLNLPLLSVAVRNDQPPPRTSGCPTKARSAYFALS